MNNEETIIQSQPLAKKSSDTPSEVTIPQPEGKKEKKGVNAWKYVTLGGVSGILMGAGLLHAGQLSAKQLEAEDSTEEDSTTSYTAENGLRVAEVDQNLSFGEAFEAARAEVGPGGVFQWHGGLYNTYTGDEWENMTPDERNDFAQLITPEVMPEDIPAPTDMQPDIAINPQTDQTFAEEGFMTDGDMASEDVMMVGMQEEGGKDEDVTVLSQEEVEAGFGGEDVHIVGYSEVEGHLAVGYDINGDNQADVAVIDVDDSHTLSEQDILVDSSGNAVTVAEAQAQNASNQGETTSDGTDYGQMAYADNPEVAPDMPDYMNDALIDA